MVLPEDWNKIEGRNYGDFKNIPTGGYICTIVKAEEAKSSKGNQMLAIYFDIFEGEYRNFYKDKYDSITSNNKKWPGVYRQLTQGKGTSYFKGLITSIEKSNEAFMFDGNENLLKNKLFGGIFGEEEYQKNDGSIGTTVKLKYITTVDKIRKGEFTIPEKRLFTLNNTTNFSSISTSNVIDDDDLPF